MSYLGRSAKLSLKAQEKVSFLATAGQTVKTGLSYTPSFVEVYVNGVLLTDTTDFTATNGNSITFTVALLLNDEVTVISLKTFTVADHYSKTEADTLLAAKSPLASPSFTGNVGIGTASPVSPNVAGTFVEIEDAVAASLVINDTGQANPYELIAGGDKFSLRYGDADLAVFKNSGNVGIGTASPASELQVEHAGGGGLTLKTSGGGNFARFTRMASGDTTNGDWSLEHSSKALVFKTNAASGSYASPSWINAMSINSAGIVTKPYQPAFLARGLSSVPASASVFIYNSVTFDRTSSYSTSTGRFTAPVAGVYLFTFNSMGNISDSRYMCRLYLNGANFAQSSSSSNSSQYQDGKLSIHVNLAVSDYVYMYNAGPKVPHSTSATEEWFSGHLVG